MPALIWIVALPLSVAVLAVVGQELRYLHWRRNAAKDRQDIFHSSSVFHVATIVSLAPGQELLAGVRDFVSASEAVGAEIVYAGKIAANPMISSQIPHGRPGLAHFLAEVSVMSEQT